MPCRFNYNARVDASYQAYGMFETGYAQFVSCFTVNSSLTFTFSLSTAVLQAYATSNPGSVSRHAGCLWQGAGTCMEGLL